MCPVHRGIRDADDDFAFAASAKVLVPGGGGYATFMADLVRKRGGKVLMPNMTAEMWPQGKQPTLCDGCDPPAER